jgi:hypothetical protein
LLAAIPLSALPTTTNARALKSDERLGENLLFCRDEDTKAMLTEAGAEAWSIYTRAELQILVEQNRIEPLSRADLKKLHDIKRTFGARITK